MLKYLLSRIPLGASGSLHNMEVLCKAFGQPQKSFESIHIAGTNGKGSTALYAANILQAHNLKTGLFTSPHLVSIRERFKINGKMISQNKLNSILKLIKKTAESTKIEPSFFEVLTIAALLWFKEEKVKAAVLEVGLGGRLDCTKIANGSIAAITSIGLDHTKILGNTKEKIIKEKLGILKKGATLILGDLPKSLISKCPPHIKSKKITPELQVKNQGKVYIKNAELAYTIAEKFLGSSFNEKLARKALKKSFCQGRMQMLYKYGELKFILDVAHNPQAAKVLAKCLKEENLPPIPCIFTSMADKDTYGVLKALKPHISCCFCVQLETPRARSAEEIRKICKKLKIANIRSQGPILITGSLYLVGKAISILSKEFKSLAEFKGLESFPNESQISSALHTR